MMREEDKPVWDTKEYHIQIHTYEKGWKVEVEISSFAEVVKCSGPAYDKLQAFRKAKAVVNSILSEYGIVDAS